MDSQPSSAPAATSIPDLVRIGSVPTDTSINVQTDILDAVIFSENEARFVLDNKGILHSNSRITFSTDGTVGTGGEGRAFFPANIGVHSLIQRAALRIGTQTVCEIEDYNHFSAYETIFLPPDAIKEREGVMSGRFMSISPTLQGRSEPFNSASNSASITESLSEAKSIQVDNGKSLTLADPTTQIWDPIGSAVAVAPSRTIFDYQKESNKPTYSVLLADLFPFLKTNQLPLFMIQEQVSIHLTFTERQSNQSSERICVTESDAITKDCVLSRSDCQMIADYIFYPQDLMEQYRQQNSNMSFAYVDYQFVKRTVSSTEYAGGLIQNVGGAGRIVNKVFCGSTLETTEAAQHGSLLNVYCAEGPEVTTATVGTVTTNLKYNDNFLYPIDVVNNARHYHNVFQSEGRVPYISRDLYRGEGQLATTQVLTPGSVDFEGYDSQEGLQSKFFWTAYRLNKGERVNSRGIEVYDTRATVGEPSTFRCWLQLMRVASLRDGMFSMSYA
tara:strand:- start:4426 stop:5928 length:1503 start_codon:yes stop_codon:yes gene_type:complete